ncbi:PAS domain-containing protein [Streptomyces sp. NPDC050738]|uniref:response regulator n=1 Tax=Streptomyces sp. NPDC050738 TaxID=3154744 RepID=UPI00342D118A
MSSRPSRGAARLAAILDALPDGLLLVNANGTVVNANTIALEAFEAPGTALVGRGLLDLLPEFDSRLIPGSMRRPESADEQGRTKPTRMHARRTDGSEFPAEVTSANLEDGREAYASYSGYSGDELLMLVVRDLSGTVDTEAELARSQRQTEMILRAASEGVVGTDTEGRVVLVNPSVAQILGFRASELGGKELHPLVQHSRADGEPFPYEDSALADTLKSGRKHRVRGQVLWHKDGSVVPVDMTTAPVRDGDQLVGAVLTFADRRPYEAQVKLHAAELKERDARHKADVGERDARYQAAVEERDARIAALEGRHRQLTAVLGDSLRGPLDVLRGELGALAADPAGQLWPEANQILHHLAAGYARMTTLVDGVLAFQRLDEGVDELKKSKVMLDAVVAAGVEGAVELIGPGRAQFAVHAPPIEAEVDGERLAAALAHLVADVAGVDATGKTRVAPGGAYVDSTIVVAVAQRGETVRIEVRGPYSGGDPVHEPIVRGIVRAHGGVLQTHEVPGMTGSAYVLEVPLGDGAGTVAPPEEPAAAAVPGQQGGGRRRARRASTDAFLDSPAEASGAAGAAAKEPTGRRRANPAAGAAAGAAAVAVDIPAQAAEPAEGSVVTSSEGAAGQAGGGRAPRGETVPPQGVPADGGGAPVGRRARRPEGVLEIENGRPSGAPTPTPAAVAAPDAESAAPQGQPGGRRARRALATAPAQGSGGAEAEAPRGPFALPPAEADRGRDLGDVQQAQEHPAPAETPQAPEAAGVPADGGTLFASPEGWAGATESPAPAAQPLPAEAPAPISVRTLGQGVPFVQQLTQQQNQSQGGQGQSLGSGRRRKLHAPPEGDRTGAAAVAAAPAEPAARPHPQQRIQAAAEGRSYAIGKPDEGAEGPEPLDGPGGAVEVANRPQPRPDEFGDDELPPEPLDNPRRLLVWPAPDVSTQQALSDRGYRPVIVHSREEVDAQIAAFPAALFVDPLTGPITRTALQSLRQAAVAAEVPVLVTAGLGQATREAAYGADPAVLLKALAPRDSEQHPSRVLLIEEHEEIALALTATLERRGMQVARAGTDAEAVTLAAQMRPNLVVMDLMQVRRRRAGIVDWLRANGQLNRTPLVVYTSAGLNQAELPKLTSGETVLFLAERSTSSEVQGRIVDLLAKIGTN